MTQITANVLKAVKTNGVVHLEVQVGGYKLVTDVTADKVDTPEKLAAWLLSQPVPADASQANLRKRLVIDFHTEDGARVLDGVSVEDLAEDKAMGDIANIPNWATWDSDQAQDWIEANVTTLATAKTAIKALAQMVILERDAIAGLKRRGE